MKVSVQGTRDKRSSPLQAATCHEPGSMLIQFLLLASAASVTRSDGVDLQMKDLASDIGLSLQSIRYYACGYSLLKVAIMLVNLDLELSCCSESFDHQVDWLFVVDQGGIQQQLGQHDFTKYFIRQLTEHLYISPSHSLVCSIMCTLIAVCVTRIMCTTACLSMLL